MLLILVGLVVLTCCVSLLPGSVPSLAAGLLFGGLAGFGAYQISNDPNNIWVSLGWYTQTVLCLLSMRLHGDTLGKVFLN